MVVIGTPVTPGTEESDSLTILRPEDATRDGCPVLTRTRTIIAARGQTGTLEWELRNRQGQVVDISELVAACDAGYDSSVADCHHVKVRFAEAFMDGCGNVVEADATIADAAGGIIQVTIPSEVAAQAGIYQMSWGVLDPDDNLVFADNGLLSIETGLWGDPPSSSGPPTLQEIRIRMRDTATDNQLLDEVEFSDAEILNALLQPVREFNDSSPPLGYRFNGKNFPYKYNWIEAAVAQLLYTAADWYRRNKMQTSHGGIQLNDRDKDNPYLQTAALMRQEWRRFIITKKASLNAEQAYGSVGSDYGSCW